MLEFYWICLISGAVITLITVIFGDVLDSFFDGILSFFSVDNIGFLHPLTVIGGFTIFGGMGIMLTEYTFFKPFNVVILSLFTSLSLSALMYFFYVKPMKNTENSTGFSIMDHVGMLAEVITTIPSKGCGEVIIKVGFGFTNEIASSYEGDEIEGGVKVVVVEVKDSVLYVVRYEEKNITYH